MTSDGAPMAQTKRSRAVNAEDTDVTRVVQAVLAARARLLVAEGRTERRRSRRDARRAWFNRRIRRQWGRALDSLEELIAVSAESGDLVAREHCNASHLFAAQELLRQRACQVAWEVHLLCARGYADGAYARWRTLHEIAVVIEFLHKFGESAAERYLQHVHVKNRKVLREYEECQRELRYPPLTGEEVGRSEAKKREVIAAYGDDFGNEYGWAATDCKVANPTFFHVRQAAGYAFWKAHYGMASHAVHAGPHGILFRLGHPQGADAAPLSGPSLMGLCDPIDATAISVTHATFAFFQSVRRLEQESLESNLEYTARIKYISTLGRRISELASRAQQRVEGRYGKKPKQPNALHPTPAGVIMSRRG